MPMISNLKTVNSNHPPVGRRRALDQARIWPRSGRSQDDEPAPSAQPRAREARRAAVRPASPGVLLFGYFHLDTQEKVTRPTGRKQTASCTARVETDVRAGGPASIKILVVSFRYFLFLWSRTNKTDVAEGLRPSVMYQSEPLVEGISPAMRGSSSTALRNARPKALNIVSLM